jgi:hypothetical protein
MAGADAGGEASLKILRDPAGSQLPAGQNFLNGSYFAPINRNCGDRNFPNTSALLCRFSEPAMI